MVDVGDDAEVPDGRLGHDAENIVEDPYPDADRHARHHEEPSASEPPADRRCSSPPRCRGRCPVRARCCSGSRPSASTSSRSTSAPACYPVALPATPGSEAAGVVEAVGEGVARLQARRPGRVHECRRRLRRVRPGARPSRLVRIPEGVTHPAGRGGAPAGHDGAVSHHVHLCRSGRVIPAWCTRRPAAPVCCICQVARKRGATRHRHRIHRREGGTRARPPARHEVIVYTREDFVAADQGAHRRRRRAGGLRFRRAAPLSFPGLDCLAPRGMMVLFGQSSGPVDTVRPRSSCAERLALPDAADAQPLHRDRRRAAVPRRRGARLGGRRHASRPHRRGVPARRAPPRRIATLEGRRTTGKVLLLP